MKSAQFRQALDTAAISNQPITNRQVDMLQAHLILSPQIQGQYRQLLQDRIDLLASKQNACCLADRDLYVEG